MDLIHPHQTLKDDTYLDEILAAHGNNPAVFDAVEVEGCHIVGTTHDGVDMVERCPDAEAQFWSVYLHGTASGNWSGGCECIGDFVTRANAETYAREVATRYGYEPRF